MGLNQGRVREMRLDASGLVQVFVLCPASAVPLPGQYLQARDAHDEQASLGTPLFLVEPARQGFWAAPLHPVRWSPGTRLELVGPLGHGFALPGDIRRLGLAACGDTVARLLPLLAHSKPARAAMTLFTDLPLPALPAAVEVYPLASLKEALDWPDQLVLDVPLERMEAIRQVLGISHGSILPCPAQVLVTASMPCAGLADCGACAVPGRRGWKLACKDGPVFDLRSLLW